MIQIWFVITCFWPDFAVMILIRFQLWFWYGFSCDTYCGSKLWFWWGFECYFHASWDICHLSMWSPVHLIGLLLGEEMRIPQWFGLNLGKHKFTLTIVSQPYQNHIKIISKPQKPSRNRPNACPGAVSVPFFETNPSGTLKKALRSQTISKPYENHIQNIPKPYLNHNPNHIKNITKPYRNHNSKFKTYQIHIFKSHQNHIQIIRTSWIWLPRGIPVL
jgi:hypothetical protein